MTTATETTREMLIRTCTLDSYESQTATLERYAANTATEWAWPYTWESLCNSLKHYQDMQQDADSVQHSQHITARWLAVSDWMNRVHDTADGTICVVDAVAVPHDYPFSRVY